MHPEDIKAAIRKKGSSQAEIARELQVNPALVSLVISGRGTSARVASKVAAIAGVPMKKLWPDKYQRAA